MTPAERVAAAMTGEPADRAPWTALLSLYGAALTGVPLKRHFTEPDAYVEGQLAVLGRFKPDLLFMPFTLVREGEIFGAVPRFFEDQPPNLLRPAATPVTFDSLFPAAIDSHPAAIYLRESLRRLVAVAGPVPVAGFALDPFALPVMLFGLDAWMEIFLFLPELSARILKLTTEHFVRWSNALLADGAACIIIPSVFVSPVLLTAELVRERVLPVLKRVLPQVAGPVLVHHTGGPILPLLEVLEGLPAAGFAIDARDDYASARRILGSERTILAGVDGLSLPHQPVVDLVARVRDMIEARRDDHRFIFTTTGADVPLATPPRLLDALAGAASGG